MNYRHIGTILSLFLLMACGIESHSQLQQNARPDDSSVRVIRVRDGSLIRFVLNSQGRGFELTCSHEQGLLNLIEATGFPSELLNSYPALAIDSQEVLKLNIDKQPRLDCENKDANLFLYKSNLKNETKYFFTAKSSRELFMFGCQGLAEAMGFKLESAFDLPANLIENGVFNAADSNDINCLRGVKIGARAVFLTGTDQNLSAIPGTVLKPISYTALNPNGEYAPLTLNKVGSCDWLEVLNINESLVIRGTASSRFRNTSCQVTVTASLGTLMQEQKILKIQGCSGFSTLDRQGQCQKVATTWHQASTPAVNGANTLGLSFSDSSNGWIAGTNGTILHSQDSGVNWIPQVSGTTMPLEDIKFLDKNFGLAVGASGTVLRTINGGSQWTKVTVSSSSYLSSIAASDATHLWIGGTGEVLRSIDAGLSWLVVKMPSAGQIWSLSFVDAFTGWAVGEAGLVFTTNDGGLNWVRVAVSTTDYLRAVVFLSADDGWILGSGGQIWRTKDAGFTWTAATISTEKSGFESLQFVTPLIGWASSNKGGLFFTRNGGEVWTPVSTGLTESINALSFTDSGHGWATSFSGKVLATDF